MTITLDDIRAQLAIPSPYHGGTGHFALPLLTLIDTQATEGSALRRHLNTWLNEGGTVLLRDDICGPFQHAPCVLAEQGSLLDGKRPYAFNDMWMTIDTAWLNCAVRTGLRPSYSCEIPKETGQATLLFDPFRLWPSWLAIVRRNGAIVRERYATRAEAWRTLDAQGLEIVPL